MNALLASGEVPGLYEGKELTALMAGCREAAQRDGVLIDSEDELFRRFTNKVHELHLPHSPLVLHGSYDRPADICAVVFGGTLLPCV